MKKYFFLFFFISFASPLFASSKGTVSAKIHSARLGEFISGVLNANNYNDDRETNPNDFLRRLNAKYKNPKRSLLNKKSVTLSEQEASFAIVAEELLKVAFAVAVKKGPDRQHLNLATRYKMGREEKDIKRLFGPIGARYLDYIENKLLEAGIMPSELDRPVVLVYPVMRFPGSFDCSNQST